MKVLLAYDYDYPIVDSICKYLRNKEYDFKTMLDNNWARLGIEAAKKVSEQEYNEAILICSSGTGVSISANKVNGVRAALCNNSSAAQICRTWNHANVLCVSSETSDIFDILDSWFQTPYGNGDVGYAIDVLHSYEYTRT